MTSTKSSITPPSTTKRRLTLERTYKASLSDVWDLWTTKRGFESWWGPGGFTAKVIDMDLRPGGELRYAMIATAPEQVEFMKNAGMPLSIEARLTYSEIVPPKRLAYTHLADFIPGAIWLPSQSEVPIASRVCRQR